MVNKLAISGITAVGAVGIVLGGAPAQAGVAPARHVPAPQDTRPWAAAQPAAIHRANGQADNGDPAGVRAVHPNELKREVADWMRAVYPYELKRAIADWAQTAYSAKPTNNGTDPRQAVAPNDPRDTSEALDHPRFKKKKLFNLGYANNNKGDARGHELKTGGNSRPFCPTHVVALYSTIYPGLCIADSIFNSSSGEVTAGKQHHHIQSDGRRHHHHH